MTTDTTQGDPREGEVSEAKPPAPTPEQELEQGTAEPIGNSVREARQLVPVDHTGISPTDMAGAVTYAQAVAKSTIALPVHLRGNVADCFAMIDMAQRAGLSPVMLMRESYVVGKQLGFSSHAWHALLEGSGLLDGTLHYEWDGEEGDMTCTVVGTLKADPRPKVYKSEKLSKLHPGHVTKTVNGDEITMVKGSQLWDRKPRMQLAYDARRDWIRLYCPRALLGIYTVDELEDYRGAPADLPLTDVTPPGGLRAGLMNDRIETGEGYRDGYAESELRDAGAKAKPTKQAPAQPAQPKAADKPKAAARPASGGKRKPAPPTKTARPAKASQRASQRSSRAVHQPSREAVKAAADRAEARSRAERAKQPMPTGKPGPAAEKHIQETLAWIENGTDAKKMDERWEREREARDTAQVPIAKRSELRAILDRKIAALGKEAKAK
jgi:hypothetical protein